MPQQFFSRSHSVNLAASGDKIPYFPQQDIVGGFVNALNGIPREGVGIAATHFCEECRGGGVSGRL